MYTYYISVGSNIGDKRGHINLALQSLQDHDAVSKVISSSLIETEPWGYTEQDIFVNGMWLCESSLAPHQMLSLLQSLEQGAGRERHIHWGPRTLDLDIILAFDEKGTMISICDERLTVPHPYFWDRTFVLEPLHELLPTFTYKGMTIGERLTQLS
ncbi:MAG: 2-amino-4-hydroxy-6-hydroxymethyldihydropteridine diphosphokinase [Veillonella dispar]|uniref:2-amino-4-hydroxy-6- hydroxymethyldihydropteridine diphosphokinase n=1 Tax=Veillonella dispar TaxID=39778 RepID=UPI0028FECA7F|nr:2-amino-4-hydroxy-6-hydroxymethyldihydropteridine diphosphokinase [Veillonella dispar]MDU1986949.1 2-amino-4-hydroxy-6-hydroxymethyldihydropteridine diphosphokinase [Veillonella dispar]